MSCREELGTISLSIWEKGRQVAPRGTFTGVSVTRSRCPGRTLIANGIPVEGECILDEMGEVGKTRVKNWAASTVLRRARASSLWFMKRKQHGG